MPNEAKTVVVRRKSAYGMIRYYPACKTSMYACEIAGTKTVTAGMIATMKRQGYNVLAQRIQPEYETM
jgi:hypothetical protein